MSLPMSKEERYTYSDYLTWDDGVRYELIDGIPYAMASPSTAHQRVSRELLKQFAVYLTGKTCEVFQAPYDVRLNYDDEDDTVVQPDLLIVCDKSKLGKNSCNGTPDMVIEILSPSTTKYDTSGKLERYLEAGVRECWIVNLERKSVLVYTLRGDIYHLVCYSKAENISVHVLDGLEINMTDVFSS